MNARSSAENCFDVIVVGAGIAGINAAYRLQTELPRSSYAILEARDNIGGTWDTFRYPGVRSDSDVFTYGVPWQPWEQERIFADGASILKYIRDATAQHGIDRHILFGHQMISGSWSSSERRWSLNVDYMDAKTVFSAGFVILCTGYYDHQRPFEAKIPGLPDFRGQVIHPQFWPKDFDYSGKQVVIIGSGATAVTLLPKLAEKAARVTMLQRSPTYILSVPSKNRRTFLDSLLPAAVVRKIERIKWIVATRMVVLFCRMVPRLARWLLRLSVSHQLPSHIPYAPHFEPRYDPWQQRLCISPDGDFFKCLHTGRADIKTDRIERVTNNRILLSSGEELEADIIITATGLKIQIAGGATFSVDGGVCQISEKYLWNGTMLQDVPNAAYLMGYTNASWTLGVDAKAQFICRLLQYLEKLKLAIVVPKLQGKDKLDEKRLLDLNATYVVRAERELPKAAHQKPWQPYDNYLSELLFARYGKIDDCLIMK